MIRKWGVGVAVLLALGTGWAAESAREIVKKSDEKMRGKSSYVEMTMTLVRPSWSREMALKAWSKGATYSLVEVVAPARDRGSRSLKRGNEMWNWVPRIERIVKIAPSLLSQSWMGSDFTNDDLINQSSIVVDYTHALVREETFDGDRCWVIEATPKPDAPVVWGHLMIWISQGSYNQRQIMFYDEVGTLVNTLSTFAVKELGGRQIPSRVEMQPADRPDQKTVLEYQKAQFDFDLSTEFFSQSHLKEKPR